MKLGDYLPLAGIAVGGYFLWKKYGGALPSVTAPNTVDLCQKNFPKWSAGQCAQRVKDLEAAISMETEAVRKISAIMEGYRAAGDLPNVHKLEGELWPHQQALFAHKNDYFIVTGLRV